MPSITSSRTLLDVSLRDSSLNVPIRVAVVGLAVAFTAATAQVAWPAPLMAVPFTLTPLAVVLTGATLGARWGSATQALYVILGALGFAVFAPSATLPPGPLRLIGPTGGYLLAYPVAAFASGWLAERGWTRTYAGACAAMLVGLAVIYAGGVSWLALAFTHSMRAAVTLGVVQFLALDVAKVFVAAMILPQAWRLVGRSDDRR